MHKHYYLASFVLALIVITFFFFISRTTVGLGLNNLIQYVFSPVQITMLHLNQNFMVRQDTVQKLKEENNKLRVQLSHMQEIQNENKALHDQFIIANQSTQKLLPAVIINMPGFIPGVIMPTQLIINQGASHRVKIGDAIISGMTMIGIVSHVSDQSSQVDLLTQKSTSLTVRDIQTGAVGILKGMGSNLLLDNVLLSDTLKIDDSIVTLGNKNLSGEGLPEGLLVGKIVSIDRDPSALFQKASVQSLTQVQKLTTVFVVINE